MATQDAGRVRNSSLAYSPSGQCMARYDKIHMFDVDLGLGEVYRESQTFQPGEHVRGWWRR